MSSSLQPQGLYNPWNSPGQNTGVGSLSLLQGIFPTQRSNPRLPYCRWILYQLSLQRSPRILGSLSLLQQIFPTQGLNPHLLHHRQILYQLSHQRSPDTVSPIIGRKNTHPRGRCTPHSHVEDMLLVFPPGVFKVTFEKIVLWGLPWWSSG